RTLLFRWLMTLWGVLLTWPMAAHASAIVVPEAPEPLEAMEQALARIVDRDEPELWEHAEADARAAAEAWRRLRDGEEGEQLASNLVWRLDAICDYLPQAAQHRRA